MAVSSNFMVYQVYGSIDLYHELIYSIASYYGQQNNLPVQIIVYTDNKEYLSKYLPSSVIYEELSTEKLVKWRGEDGFVHRVKVEMLIDCCLQYKGNIVYLDTDTVFIDSPDKLFLAMENDLLVMHTNEGRMSKTRNRIFDKMVRFLKDKDFEVNGNRISIVPEQEVWNAGVLGFNSSKIGLLYEVLALTDVLYKQYRKHIMEQLAFSYVFSRSGLLVAAQNQVFHYWNFKEFRPLLKEFLSVEDSYEKVMGTFRSIDPTRLILPKMKFERQAHLVQQVKKHLLNQKWKMPSYAQIIANQKSVNTIES